MSQEWMYNISVIAVITAVTFALRALPFVMFGARPLPKAIQYLGSVLPPAIMTVLVIYCMRGIDFAKTPFGFCEISAALLVVVLQCTKKNMYLSIVAGTLYYMAVLRLMA